MKRTIDEPFYQLSEAQILTLCCYLEARNQSEEGQIAVMQVIANRVKRGGWFMDSSLKRVGLSPWHCVVLKNALVGCKIKGMPCSKYVYQFSCFQEGDPNRAKGLKQCNNYTLDTSLAEKVIAGELEDTSKGALYYYAPQVCSPAWAKSMTETAVIGDHRFMKENQ